LGLSCLVTLALRHAASQVTGGTSAPVAATHGYVLAYHVGSVLLVIGGVLVLFLLEHVVAARTALAEVDEGEFTAAVR
jgi:hypothetical protein